MDQELRKEMRVDDGWHLKKEVPIATILTVLIAIGSGTLWMINIRSDVDLLRHDFAKHEIQDEKRERRADLTAERTLSTLNEIKDDITQIKVSVAGKR